MTVKPSIRITTGLSGTRILYAAFFQYIDWHVRTVSADENRASGVLLIFVASNTRKQAIINPIVIWVMQCVYHQSLTFFLYGQFFMYDWKPDGFPYYQIVVIFSEDFITGLRKNTIASLLMSWKRLIGFQQERTKRKLSKHEARDIVLLDLSSITMHDHWLVLWHYCDQFTWEFDQYVENKHLICKFRHNSLQVVCTLQYSC